MTAGLDLTPSLPEPIAAYFAADRLDGEAVTRSFTMNAVVKDEGRTYTGLASIRRWKDEASAKYQYTCEPWRAEQTEARTVVTCRLTGTFPGSPIDLRYDFRLERGKIAHLEIHP
jgi:hypothetical protein